MRAFQRGVVATAIVTAFGATACTGEATFCSGDFCGGGDAGTDVGPARTDAGHDAKVDAHRDATADAPNVGPDGETKDTATDAHGSVDAMKDVAVDSFVCDGTKTPKDEPCVISETYGVFVAPPGSGGSDTTGTGTEAKPYATLGTAIVRAKAAGKRVYACAATYAEQVVVNAAVDGVQVYGGLACPASDASADGGGSAWSYTGAKAVISPSATGFALDVESVTGAVFEDMGFTVQAAPTTPAGSSSIAVIVSGSTGVSFTRVSAIAGAGTAGVNAGTPATNWCSATGQAGSAATGTGGGNSGMCTCAVVTADSSAGGPGGAETANGFNGTSAPPVASPLTNLGAGSSAIGSGGFCSNGHPGANGAAPVGGTGGPIGTLSSTGWSAQPAGDGTAGNPGQGGGGGGGGAALGGAGGGAGGCGGNGGAGGSGGGASLAVAVVSSTVSFASMTLVTGLAGAGGMGAPGEAGQQGAGQTFGGTGCNGGAGGAGAGGAGGGGGAGGPSVGIAWTGTSTALTIDGSPVTTLTSLSSLSTFTSGGGGAVGSGGSAGAAATGGSPGLAGTSGPAGSSNAVVGF